MKDITIAQSFEKVFNYISAKDSKRGTDEPTKETATELNTARPSECYAHLNEKMGLSETQANLMACILNNSLDKDITSSNIASTMGISNMQFLTMRPELEALIERRLVRTSSRNMRCARYNVPNYVLKAVASNQTPNNSDFCGLSNGQLTRKIHNCIRSFWADEYDYETLDSEIKLLIASNPETNIVSAYNKHKMFDLNGFETMMFFYMLVRNVVYMDNSFGMQEFERLFKDCEYVDEIMLNVQLGKLDIIKAGLVEHANSDGLQDMGELCLTKQALNEFVPDVAALRSNVPGNTNAAKIIRHESIKSKRMFYNERERKEIDRLCELLERNKFRQVTERLEEKGMRKGFACLFYGAAGTGKTETCYSLSAMTGRDIFFVDMAEIKSKWVGDSERNVRDLFASYRNAVRDNNLAPIMVWNEVDAIFGRRRKVENAVDKMENAMQNIILQELENLEGILIATTNLNIKDGFDPAFERRFIIKVCFDKPNAGTRSKIWKSMFGADLSESDASTLAQEFDFSGGTIENINRKSTVDYILSGQRPTLDSLREMCLAENLEQKEKKRIGY